MSLIDSLFIGAIIGLPIGIVIGVIIHLKTRTEIDRTKSARDLCLKALTPKGISCKKHYELWRECAYPTSGESS